MNTYECYECDRDFETEEEILEPEDRLCPSCLADLEEEEEGGDNDEDEEDEEFYEDEEEEAE